MNQQIRIGHKLTNDDLLLLINSVKDYAIIMLDLHGNIISWNKGAENIKGYKAEEIIGKHFSNFYPIEDIAKNEPLLNLQHAEKYGSCTNTGWRLRKDGTWFWAEVVITGLYEDSGQLRGFVKITKDSTTQKEINDELEKIRAEVERINAEKLNSSLKEIADYKLALDESSIVAITDQKGIIKYVNDNFCKISKYSREELIGQDHRIINSGFHDKEFMRDLWVTIANGKIWRGEFKNRAKDGSHYWVESTIVPFLNSKGKPYQYVSIRVDITEKKIQQELFYKAEANLRTIFNHTDTAFILVDEDFKIISFNKMAEVYAWKEFRRIMTEGSDAKRLLFKQRKSHQGNIIQRVMQGEIISYEINFKQKDESINWYNAKWINVNDNANNSIGVIVAINDITANKLLEIERGRITADLIQRNKDLEQLTYIISHNLRAPVANIIGLANLVDVAEIPGEENQELISGIKFCINQLDQIILDLNHILQVKRAYEKLENVYFERLTFAITESIQQLIDKEKVTFNINFTEVNSIITLKSYIYSIFYNLIVNSIKYREPGRDPVIKLSSQKSGNKIILNFEDNGRGIDLKKNDKNIFGLYKRFDTSVEGKGMGLFMVKTQVEALGGRINVTSKIKKGTKFKIELYA